MDSRPEMNEGPLVLYDGVCGLCNHTVQFLLKRDRAEALRFAPLQGETISELRNRHPIPDDLSTFVLLDDGEMYLRSSAFVRLVRYLPYPWKLFRIAWIIPRPIRDLLYRLVARYRYRLFGEKDACSIPDPSVRHRFLP